MTSSSITTSSLHALLKGFDEFRYELVIDVRSRAEFNRRHIAGSHHLSPAALVSGELPDHDLVLIAESDQRALQLADTLHSRGFHRRIRHLQGGIQAWVEADLPLEQASTHANDHQPVKDLIPVGLLVGIASLALSLQHASILLFSVTLALLVAPLALGNRTQRLLQPLRRRSISGA